HSKSLIDGMTLPVIGFGYEGQPVAVLGRDRCSFVRRTAVYDDIFDSWIVLVEHAFDCGTNELPLVKRGRDNRDQRLLHSKPSCTVSVSWFGAQRGRISRLVLVARTSWLRFRRHVELVRRRSGQIASSWRWDWPR